MYVYIYINRHTHLWVYILLLGWLFELPNFSVATIKQSAEKYSLDSLDQIILTSKTFQSPIVYKVSSSVSIAYSYCVMSITILRPYRVRCNSCLYNFWLPNSISMWMQRAGLQHTSVIQHNIPSSSTAPFHFLRFLFKSYTKANSNAQITVCMQSILFFRNAMIKYSTVTCW